MPGQQDRDQQEHWRDLAVLLGLEPEPPPEPPVAPAPKVETPVPEPERHYEAASPPEDETRQFESESQMNEEPIASVAEERPLPDEEDRPRRGRGRRGRRDDRGGRRGRGSRGRRGESRAERGPREERPERAERFAVEPRQTGEEPVPPDDELERMDEEIPDEATAEQGRFDEDELLPEPERAHEEAEDSEDELITDWNVPSWAELIASLYRPER
jgi:hypothetical protein